MGLSLGKFCLASRFSKHGCMFRALDFELAIPFCLNYRQLEKYKFIILMAN